MGKQSNRPYSHNTNVTPFYTLLREINNQFNVRRHNSIAFQ